MVCACCMKRPESDTDVGLMIRPVGFLRGEKSGELMMEGDFYPDGQEEKYLCWDCIETPPGGQTLPELLGFQDPGYDFPSEPEPPDLHSMQAPVQAWGQGSDDQFDPLGGGGSEVWSPIYGPR